MEAGANRAGSSSGDSFCGALYDLLLCGALRSLTRKKAAQWTAFFLLRTLVQNPRSLRQVLSFYSVDTYTQLHRLHKLGRFYGCCVRCVSCVSLPPLHRLHSLQGQVSEFYTACLDSELVAVRLNSIANSIPDTIKVSQLNEIDATSKRYSRLIP